MEQGISIVIPAYNEALYLAKTLEAILEATAYLHSELNIPSEIIVVDNDSNDATTEIAQGYGVKTFLFQERNIAAVRNYGVGKSGHSVVVTVDADTFVPRPGFVKIWEALETGRHFGGGVRTGVRSKRRLLRFSYAIINKIILARERVSLGMFFCQRDVFQEIGGFPEEFLVGEDLAFARKLRDYSKSRGLVYCNLQSVKIETLARKAATISETCHAYWNSAKVALGHPVTRESLGYWYDPRR